MNSLIGLTLTLVYIENSWPFSPQIIFYSWLPLTVHFLAFPHMSLPSQTPLTFLLHNLTFEYSCFVLGSLLLSVPHSLEGISASLLALNFNRLPKTPKPISPALTFSQISRPAQQTIHTVLLAGLMSISNLTWPKQSFPFFMFETASLPIFLSQYLLLLGTSLDQTKNLGITFDFSLYLITSLSSSQSTRKS